MAGGDLVSPDGQKFAELSASFDVVEIDENRSERLADLYLEVCCTDWSMSELLEWAESVILTTVEPREQRWVSSQVGKGRGYSLTLDGSDIESFFVQLESPGVPGKSIPGKEAHYTHRARLTDSTVNGEAVKALCGVWFVPRQDHHSLSVCGECEVVKRLLTP